ncbi:SGNH/GDSL hydrolase family protein [Leptospira sp. GIMC2001]|uniref:SGNH/GDSL hydrolase family protein n=1 Tax=Leptospira sp. GIMC2001 TaxID=1513297 RepID=UPI00234AE515|nr:SGNH/GDSL hydrolase family protein [Leptospira sp. GIMC2001]WCL49716.1 SGNH/GDSL hydrolase family protein [Leptospira sp. GIMC2001]
MAPKLMPLHLSSFRFSNNPKIGYELIPHYTEEKNTAITELSGYAIDISNSNGFRDIERKVEKTPGISRVVALGDSITHGYFVKDYRERYTDRLQEMFPKSEFINLGVSGYNTMQEVALFRERGLMYKPDLVTIGYCLNDDEGANINIYLSLKYMLKKHGNVVDTSALKESNPILANSSLYRLLRYKVFNNQVIEAENEYMTKTETEDEALKELQELAKKHNFKVAMFIFPIFDDLVNYKYQAKHNRIMKIAKSNSIPALDLLPSFQECYKKEKGSIIADHFHPSGAGHKCAADSIKTFILQNKLL